SFPKKQSRADRANHAPRGLLRLIALARQRDDAWDRSGRREVADLAAAVAEDRRRRLLRQAVALEEGDEILRRHRLLRQRLQSLGVQFEIVAGPDDRVAVL